MPKSILNHHSPMSYRLQALTWGTNAWCSSQLNSSIHPPRVCVSKIKGCGLCWVALLLLPSYSVHDDPGLGYISPRLPSGGREGRRHRSRHMEVGGRATGGNGDLRNFVFGNEDPTYLSSPKAEFIPSLVWTNIYRALTACQSAYGWRRGKWLIV